MNNIAVLGAQFGDEAKGRITHYLSPNYDWVIRFNGGGNAGHTLYRNGEKFVHNLLPSVDFRNSKTKCYLGAGMVIDLPQLLIEVEVANKKYANVGSRLFIDNNAFIVSLEHKEIDAAKNGHIGSTKRGIGPAYMDKISRNGKRIFDIKDTYEYNKLKELGVTFTDSLSLINEFKNSNCLFEGAQGVLLDINFGTYPYVSCSDATISGIGASYFNFLKLDKVYGVAKCYSTRVGEGPFPSEILGEPALKLREAGNEYGATTGRPRRVGWFDLPALNYACKVSGITNLIITKFDVLEYMENIPVITKYLNEKDEEFIPTSPRHFFEVKSTKTTLVHNPDMEMGALNLKSLIEESLHIPVSYMTFGLDDTLIKKY